jgi:hypothetical protein
MATIVIKKPCAKCSNGSGVTTCDGCQQSFCTKHFVEHRQELTQQMNTINQDHDLVRRDASVKDITKHSFATRIDAWEQESIHKIRTVAEAARTDLRELLDRTQLNLKMSIEKMNDELQSCRKSDDFTENDLKRWNEQLKKLRKQLDNPVTMSIMNEDDPDAVIRLIKISDKQLVHVSNSPVRQFDQRRHSTKDSISNIYERFGNIDGKATLSDDARLVTSGLASILTQPIVYGVNRYTTGKHSIRFRIEKLGESRLFIGIIRSLENISRSGQGQTNNMSLYGWWDLNEPVINGKVQVTKYRNIILAGDEILLTLDCDKQHIQLQHQRTKRLAQLSIDLDKCPLSWKIVIRLQSAGDCIRILW